MNFLLVFDVLKGMYLSRDQLRFVERRIPGLLDVASSCVPMKSWTIMFQRWLLAQVLYLHNWHIGQRWILRIRPRLPVKHEQLTSFLFQPSEYPQLSPASLATNFLWMWVPFQPRACYIFRDFLHHLNSGAVVLEEIRLADVQIPVHHGRVDLSGTPLAAHTWFQEFMSWFAAAVDDERLLPDHERLFSACVGGPSVEVLQVPTLRIWDGYDPLIHATLRQHLPLGNSWWRCYATVFRTAWSLGGNCWITHQVQWPTIGQFGDIKWHCKIIHLSTCTSTGKTEEFGTK